MSSGVRLAVWSGPRNISTALMRSWGNRPDCRVVDEPLYAYYLVETGVEHPGRNEVIAAGETSWQAVVADLTGPVDGVYYQKHMAHHLITQLPREWISSLNNVLLIRDPAEVVASYIRLRGDVAEEDIGLVRQKEIYDQLGGAVPVIDSADFLRDPEGYLRWLCAHVGVEFTESMLRWRLGPATPTACGRATGTTRCSHPPASNHIAGRGSSCPTRPRGPCNGAARTTSICTPCASWSDWRPRAG